MTKPLRTKLTRRERIGRTLRRIFLGSEVPTNFYKMTPEQQYDWCEQVLNGLVKQVNENKRTAGDTWGRSGRHQSSVPPEVDASTDGGDSTGDGTAATDPGDADAPTGAERSS